MSLFWGIYYSLEVHLLTLPFSINAFKVQDTKAQKYLQKGVNRDKDNSIHFVKVSEKFIVLLCVIESICYTARIRNQFNILGTYLNQRSLRGH